MSQKILNIGDLDLNLHGQIGFQPSKILVLTIKNFIFQLELLIDHLNVSDLFANQ